MVNVTPRRQSSRLLARYNHTPVSTVASQLQTLAEYEEKQQQRTATPNRTAPQERTTTPLPQTTFTPTAAPTPTPHPITQAAQAQQTPKHAPLTPAPHSMHPQLFHQTTAKPMEEARWLGFSNLPPAVPHTEPVKRHAHTLASRIAVKQGTPSKSVMCGTPVAKGEGMGMELGLEGRMPKFEFTFRKQSLELSPEAKRLMEEMRGEAGRIRERMRRDGAVREEQEEGGGEGGKLGQVFRRIKRATGVRTSDRFGEAHEREFRKMDSIAGHPSAFRGLKRTNSKMELGKSEEKRAEKEKVVGHGLKRSNSVRSLNQAHGDGANRVKGEAESRPGSSSSMEVAASGPVKRLRLNKEDDISVGRPSSRDSNKDEPARPTGIPTPKPSFMSPTKSALVRSTSVKNLKAASTPSLQRSPSKPDLASASKIPSLSRAPSVKSLRGEKPLPAQPQAEALSRKPLPAQPATEPAATPAKDEKPLPDIPGSFPTATPTRTPSLTRASIKAALNPHSIVDPLTTPRTTTKVPIPSTPHHPKSILRQPQRLYSDDPFKIALGTHLASPPIIKANTNKGLPKIPQTLPVKKHVNFNFDFSPEGRIGSFTTKLFKTAQPAREAVAPIAYPTLPKTFSDDADVSAAATPAQQDVVMGSSSPLAPATLKKRASLGLPLGAGDFTFRAGSPIKFNDLPAPSPSSAKTTIRRVVSDAAAARVSPTRAPVGKISGVLGALSRKRKFLMEGDAAAAAAAGGGSGKENTPNLPEQQQEEEAEADDEAYQPSRKRVRRSMGLGSAADGEKAKNEQGKETNRGGEVKASRLPRFGKAGQMGGNVNGRGQGKRGSVLSQARLNLLAQPKARK